MAASTDHCVSTNLSDQCNPAHVKPHAQHKMLLIYADKDLQNENTDFQNILEKLRDRINEVHLFNDANDCVKYLNQLKTERVIVIISGSIREDLLPKMDPLPQVHAIYLIDEEPIYDQQCNKVKGSYANIEPIYDCLSKDFKQYHENEVSITFQRTDKNQLQPSFMWSQLFKNVLLEMKHDPQSRNEFVSFCRKTYAGDEFKLKIIDEFDQKYRPDQAIWWYSRPTFIYEILNRALRLSQGDIIINMGFFIHDLHDQIKQLHDEQMRQFTGTSIHLFRGQKMSVNDYEQMMNNRGQLMSFNGFLSTTEDKAVALAFASTDRSDLNNVGIRFEISIDPKIVSTPFAKITSKSHVSEEDENLFSMHTVFQIGEIIPLDEHNRQYEVQLTLTADDDRELRRLTNQMALEIFEYSETEKLRVLLMRIGQDDEAEQRYLDILFRPVSPSEQVYCYHRLGMINRNRGDLDRALQYYQSALSTQTVISSKNDPACEGLYHSMGALHSLMGRYETALNYYKSALEIRGEYGSSNDSLLGVLYNSIGMTHHEMGQYSDACSNYEKALQILRKEYCHNHPILAKTDLNMCAVMLAKGEHSKALEYGQPALEVFEKTLCPNHLWLAEAHNNVGAVHSAMKNYEQAQAHYQQALNNLETNNSRHPRLSGAIYVNLGGLYSKRHDYPEALVHFNKALEIFQPMLLSHHPHIALVWINIADIYEQIKEYSDALLYYEKALTILKKVYPDHPMSITVYNKLGATCFMMNDYPNALLFYKQALNSTKNSTKKTQLQDHSLSATLYDNLGFVYYQVEEFVLAVLHLQKALEIRRSHHLPVDPGCESFCEKLMPIVAIICTNYPYGSSTDELINLYSRRMQINLIDSTLAL